MYPSIVVSHSLEREDKVGQHGFHSANHVPTRGDSKVSNGERFEDHHRAYREWSASQASRPACPPPKCSNAVPYTGGSAATRA